MENNTTLVINEPPVYCKKCFGLISGTFAGEIKLCTCNEEEDINDIIDIIENGAHIEKHFEEIDSKYIIRRKINN